MAAAAAFAAAAVAVEGDENHAFALGVGNFVLHIVKSVKTFAVKICKFFIAHKKHLLKNTISCGGQKMKGKNF